MEKIQITSTLMEKKKKTGLRSQRNEEIQTKLK